MLADLGGVYEILVAVLGTIALLGAAGGTLVVVGWLRRRALKRRDSHNADAARKQQREKYLERLRDHLTESEARASADLDEARHTNRLAGFSQWIRTNRKGIVGDDHLLELVEPWDRLLAHADAHHDGWQAAWNAILDANAIPLYGEEDRQRLMALLAAIIEARREVEPSCASSYSARTAQLSTLG